MRKYRYFGGLLDTQEKWLNQMAGRGWRLVRTGKLLYEFEPCPPDAYQYHMEFVGEKSAGNSRDYQAFLTELGYRVFPKNINLNFSVGKVRYRPWAEPGGRLATSAGAFNRELLIVEKQRDGKPFSLHTTNEDRAKYYATLRNAWFWAFLLFALCAVVFAVNGQLWWMWIWAALAVVFLIPALLYQARVVRCRRDADTREWKATQVAAMLGAPENFRRSHSIGEFRICPIAH